MKYFLRKLCNTSHKTTNHKRENNQNEVKSTYCTTIEKEKSCTKK